MKNCVVENLDNRIIYAAIVGAVLFALGIALRLFANQEGLQLILFFVTSFFVGIVVVGIKRGFLLSFVLAFIFALVNNLILSPGVFNDPNVAAAVIIFLGLLPSLIGGALGAVGGVVGRRIFKKQTKT